MASRNRSQIEDKISDQDLDLSCEGLVDIPVKEIASFPRVNCIDLSNNHIRTVTVDFPSSLRQIVHLDLSKNLIQKLPDNFGLLVNLRHLDLYSNQLARLPLSMTKLRKLRWLDLKDNPLVPTLKKVAGECFNADQCQLCAKNVVAFMTQIEQQVGEQDSSVNSSDSHLQQQSFNNSKIRSGGVQNTDMINGRSNRNRANSSVNSSSLQEFSSDDEMENLSSSRDEVITTKKKRKRNSNKRAFLPAPVDDAEVVDEYVSSSGAGAGVFKECVMWLLRSSIWLLLFLGVFILLCSLCLSNAGLKNVISTVSSNEQVNQYLINRHEWIQRDLLKPGAITTLRDYGKDYFALFLNYFYTLVESVVHSVDVLTNSIGK